MDGRCGVLIVDDHDGFRAWARAHLEAEGYRVVGEAASGRDALRSVRESRPDVVLLDVGLPDLDGFEVARRLSGAPGCPAVVLVSSREPADFGRRVVDSCARGYIAKPDLSAARLRAVISGTHRG